MPPTRGPRPRRYCSRACQAKAYRARHGTTTAAVGERAAAARYAGISSKEVAGQLAAAASRTAGALDAGRSADESDLEILAVAPVALAARAKATAPGHADARVPASASGPAAADATAPEPRPPVRTASPTAGTRATARATDTPQASRDDLGAAPHSAAAPRAARKTARPARRRLTRKQAAAIADTARMVKHPDHRENHRWIVQADDGTVLGYVDPSYGGTSRSGRDGWIGRTAEAVATTGGRQKTRQDAAVQVAMAWVRVVTAKPA